MLEDLLVKGLLVALEKFGIFEEDIDILLEKPRDRSHGDLSTNLAMVLGKRLGRKPRELAGEIAAGIDFPKSLVESVEIAGPGFINFRLARSYKVEMLLNLLAPDGAMEDIRTGKLKNEVLNEKVLSAIIECQFPIEKIKDIIPKKITEN